MKYKIILTPTFENQAHELAKKYPNIIDDFLELKDRLKKDPITGADPYGKDCYKIRMAITDKEQGKSGGARVVYQVLVKDGCVYMLTVFDKSEKETIKPFALGKLLKKEGLKK